MQPIYLVDRYLTGTLKEFSEWLISRGLSLKYQFWIPLILVLVGVNFILPGAKFSLEREAAFLACWIAFFYVPVFMEHLLYLLHRVLDEDALIHPKKHYSDGHYAWGLICTGILFILALQFVSYTFFSSYLITNAMLCFVVAYIAFISRKEDNNWGKKKKRSFLLGPFQQLASILLPSPTT